ncbi:phenylacetate--CoA ligase family protein [Chloroflexota bacterium]
MYEFIAIHMMAPMMDFLRNTRTMKCLNELEKSQWWSQDSILDLQNQRLTRLVQHAYSNVPYYRRIFDERALKPKDIQNSGDLKKLPVLTKQLVRDKIGEIMAQGLPEKGIAPIRTSGSTGEPLFFYATKNVSNWSAASQRAWGWAGYRIGCKCVSLTNRHPYQSSLHEIRERAALFFERKMFLNITKMSIDKVSSYAKSLVNFQPEFLMGYPSGIYQLGRFIERECLPRPKLKAIISVAEQLYYSQRNYLSQLFGCETYDFYSARETSAIASECSEHSGYHITAENVVVEVIDADSNPVPENVEGRILVTNLHNYAVPFIRYDIGDMGAYSNKVCPCGRGLPLLAFLSGRICDNIMTPSGGVIPGMALAPIYFALPGVEQYQIAQESYYEVVVRIVPDKKYPREHLNKLAKQILNQHRHLFEQDMSFSVEFVDQIPRTEAGKIRVVISCLSQESEGNTQISE